MTDWHQTYADPWARTVHTVLRTVYPYAAQHESLDAGDVDVTPDRLHPAFHGSFDWHSSVHMHWSGVVLLTEAADRLDSGTLSELGAVLDERLTLDNLATEVAYLRARPRFRRPYGWAWAARLAATARRSPVAQEHGWDRATAPLLDVIADLVLDWLPQLAYPVRSGEHDNLAFGLALVHEAMSESGRDDVVSLVEESATRWYAADHDAPVSWEPGGSDFLSPALCEADLMRRVLPEGEYAGWLAGFLPGLGSATDPLLGVPEVLDPTDGKAVHLYGLGLSRAWQLRLLAPYLSEQNRDRALAAARKQVEQVEGQIATGDFMATHWLVSFALLAVRLDTLEG